MPCHMAADDGGNMVE